ncbi:unnamed protein product [Ixodes pacificus]
MTTTTMMMAARKSFLEAFATRAACTAAITRATSKNRPTFTKRKLKL